MHLGFFSDCFSVTNHQCYGFHTLHFFLSQIFLDSRVPSPIKNSAVLMSPSQYYCISVVLSLHFVIWPSYTLFPTGIGLNRLDEITHVAHLYPCSPSHPHCSSSAETWPGVQTRHRSFHIYTRHKMDALFCDIDRSAHMSRSFHSSHLSHWVYFACSLLLVLFSGIVLLYIKGLCVGCAFVASCSSLL